MSAAQHGLRVALAERAYDIRIEAGLLDRADQALADILEGRRAILVTDGNLAATRHPERLTAALARLGVKPETEVVEPGEGSKSWAALSALCESILARRIDRQTAIIAMGGGVVGDLAGFAAAVLLRGLDVIQIPTTLLAQVDSSAGGKTGINSPHGKNLIGAFHQPRRVLIDPTVLDGLPGREVRAGYAELVKHAFIRDAGLFEQLEQELGALLGGDVERLTAAIARSIAVKVAIVGADERETKGERALLNFGHTFAHAFETLTGYSGRLLHGEAVALGMAHAFDLSVRLGLCSGQDAGRAKAHLAAAGLPVRAHERELAFAPDEVIAAMGRDKKVEQGRLTFVVSRGIGGAELCGHVPLEDLRAVLSHHD
jgi:3-dehydroquinate synthase